EGNHQRIAVDELQNQRAAPDDDGHADQQAEDHQADLMVGMSPLRRPGDGDDVVQAHDEVRDDDRLDSRQDRDVAGNLVMPAFFGQQQLDADPQQQQRADDLQEGNAEQRQGEGDQRHPQYDGPGRPPQDALHALGARQVAAGQGDDDGVVSAQQDVDQDDLENACPMQRFDEFDHAVPPVMKGRFSVRTAGRIRP